MTVIGYHCSHERYTPSELLRLACLAEESGFQAVMCSDHFHPWNEAQGQSGYTWSWLGAAMQATQTVSFGMVCAPGQRYFPPIIAQAAATLEEMFPGRLWCAFGSGQYLNEHITGGGWLPKPERWARLRESVDVIRALWAGETVTHRSPYLVVEEAKLYTRPAQPPRILCAALSEETAAWAATWADGVITGAKPKADQARFIEAFRRAGGDGKPIFVQALHAWAPDEDDALRGAWREWRTNVFGSEIQADLKMPSHFEAVASRVRPDDVASIVRLSANLDDHVRWLQDDISLGVDRVYVHNASTHADRFIEIFGQHVLPALDVDKVKP